MLVAVIVAFAAGKPAPHLIAGSPLLYSGYTPYTAGSYFLPSTGLFAPTAYSAYGEIMRIIHFVISKLFMI